MHLKITQHKMIEFFWPFLPLQGQNVETIIGAVYKYDQLLAAGILGADLS